MNNTLTIKAKTTTFDEVLVKNYGFKKIAENTYYTGSGSVAHGITFKIKISTLNPYLCSLEIHDYSEAGYDLIDYDTQIEIDSSFYVINNKLFEYSLFNKNYEKVEFEIPEHLQIT